ncbi:hypothetical protein FA15DRAFT_71205 [Coprinopsis marcescibilis]|uniref:Uncharacterized protein n=1 Tax=Coprinopsis marcescibilis TaxID=230819 RepID=A0A5C3KMZ5_COPMA|nr:hypothetical protein FA15DRAFT_71205 [Coprinopsis marcescibilis]
MLTTTLTIRLVFTIFLICFTGSTFGAALPNQFTLTLDTAFPCQGKFCTIRCPLHDKVGWGLSLSVTKPPQGRTVSTRQDRIVLRKGMGGDSEAEANDELRCQYPINTLDNRSMCVYSKTSGKLIRDQNMGSCLESVWSRMQPGTSVS